eukprot:4200152-Prymnesium_polylepis.2
MLVRKCSLKRGARQLVLSLIVPHILSCSVQTHTCSGENSPVAAAAACRSSGSNEGAVVTFDASHMTGMPGNVPMKVSTTSTKGGALMLKPCTIPTSDTVVSLDPSYSTPNEMTPRDFRAMIIPLAIESREASTRFQYAKPSPPSRLPSTLAAARYPTMGIMVGAVEPSVPTTSAGRSSGGPTITRKRGRPFMISRNMDVAPVAVPPLPNSIDLKS